MCQNNVFATLNINNLCILTVNLYWEAKLPVVFGDVAYLQCQISDASFDCTKSLRQWYGGPDYSSICYDSTCAASNKYEVMKQPRCQYTLIIYNFSERDGNCEYTCLYGISFMRRNLTLDEKKFICKYNQCVLHEYWKN